MSCEGRSWGSRWRLGGRLQAAECSPSPAPSATKAHRVHGALALLGAGREREQRGADGAQRDGHVQPGEEGALGGEEGLQGSERGDGVGWRSGWVSARPRECRKRPGPFASLHSPSSPWAPAAAARCPRGRPGPAGPAGRRQALQKQRKSDGRRQQRVRMVSARAEVRHRSSPTRCPRKQPATALLTHARPPRRPWCWCASGAAWGRPPAAGAAPAPRSPAAAAASSLAARWRARRGRCRGGGEGRDSSMEGQHSAASGQVWHAHSVHVAQGLTRAQSAWARAPRPGWRRGSRRRRSSRAPAMMREGRFGTAKGAAERGSEGGRARRPRRTGHKQARHDHSGRSGRSTRQLTACTMSGKSTAVPWMNLEDLWTCGG